MEERGIIDIERHLTDRNERHTQFFRIINAKIARDEAAEWIEGEPADGSFDPAFSKFLNNPGAPLPAEALVREIPTAPKQKYENDQSEQAHPARD